MNYEGQICRAPMERGSFMLPVQVGCSYNGCRFCTLFKHLQFRILPREQVKAELERVKGLGGDPKRVFLGDGSAFDLETDRLLDIASMVHEAFPGCTEIAMDSSVRGIASKTDEELRALADAGVKRLYVGIETGLDDVLTFMAKGATAGDARLQTARIAAAGIEYGAHIMTGVAGEGRGLENARATAALLNETRPAAICNFSMFVGRRAPLWKSVMDGSFRPAPLAEAMEEERLLIELLDIETDYDGFQDIVEFRTRGRLPQDREKMLKDLDAAIEKYKAQPPIYTCTEDPTGAVFRDQAASAGK